MQKVTDPALLSQLNGSAPQQAPQQAPQPRRPVFIADQGAIDDANRADTSLGYQGEGNARDARREVNDRGDKRFDQTVKLSEQYNRDPTIAAYRDRIGNLATGLKTADNPFGDNTLITLYVKTMDEGVVNEGEREGVADAQGAMTSRIEKAKRDFGIDAKTGMFTPENRTRIRREMISRLGTLVKGYNQRREYYGQQAQSFNLDPTVIIGGHDADPLVPLFQEYDQANGLGEFAPGQQRRGQIPGATADNLAFDIDQGTGAFGSQIEAPRLNPQQQGALDAFLKANAGNPNFGPDQLSAFYQSMGIQGGAMPADDTFFEAVRKGEAFGTQPNYEAADAARRAELERLATERYGEDPTTRASLLAKGGMMNWSDEAAGVLGAVYDTVTGGSPVEGYQRERDLERYIQEESRDKYGVGYEIAGSLATPLGRMKAPKTATEFAKQGAKLGAVAGSGEGEGVAGTVGGTIVGGGLGGATALGGKKLFDAAAGTQVGQKIAGALTRSPDNAAQEFTDAAKRQKLDYMMADVPGSRITQFITSVAKSTLGGIPLSESAAKIAVKAREARDRVAGAVGNVTDTVGAGQSAQRGMETWKAATGDRGGKLYDAIPIKPETPVALTATRQKLAELNSSISSNDELAALVRDPKMVAYQKALDAGDLSWNDIKQFRSYIGEKAGRPTLQQDTSKDSLDALYGSLSQDIQQAASAHSPEAAKAFSRANNYWRGRQTRLNDVMTKLVGKDGNMTPEATFQQIERWAGQKGGDFASLARAVRSLPEDEANTVRATIIDRLGNSNPGSQGAANDSFSADVFMTQWSKLSDRGKAVLFQGDHRKALDDLATVFEGSKFSRGFDNNSKTSIGTNAIGLAATAAFVDPITAIAFSALQFGGGAALASPHLARWMVALTRKPNASAQLAHVKQLGAIAKAEPALANNIFSLQERLAQAFAQPSALRSAAEEDNKLGNPPPAQGEGGNAQ